MVAGVVAKKGLGRQLRGCWAGRGLGGLGEDRGAGEGCGGR